jgi:hypothetical protein
MIIFGYQDGWLRPGYSHTFATFAKVDSSAGQMMLHETVDISWLPDKLRPGQQIWDWVLPVKGRNFSLKESFECAAAPGLKLKTFGPVEVSPELYEAARLKSERLASGKIAYVMLDNLFRGRVMGGQEGAASNCIHAVSDLGLAAPLISHVTYGHKASELVFQHFSPFVNKGASGLVIAQAAELLKQSFSGLGLKPSLPDVA